MKNIIKMIYKIENRIKNIVRATIESVLDEKLKTPYFNDWGDHIQVIVNGEVKYMTPSTKWGEEYKTLNLSINDDFIQWQVWDSGKLLNSMLVRLKLLKERDNNEHHQTRNN